MDKSNVFTDSITKLDKRFVLSDFTLKLNWIQRHTNYIIAGIFKLKDKPDECIVLVIPGIHELIEGDTLIEEEFDTEVGKINILDVRSLKMSYKGKLFNIEALDKQEHIIVNPFINHVLKANDEYMHSEKTLKALQNTERKVKNLIHQMIYEDVLKRDIIAYQMIKTKGNNQNIRK